MDPSSSAAINLSFSFRTPSIEQERYHFFTNSL
jgi:hypothetical protein